MKRTLVRLRNSKFRQFIRNYEKAAPVIFFIGGFVFDLFTLGRIDRLYDLTILSFHMTLLTITLYLYNIAKDEKLKNIFLVRYQEYFPLAIQFFFGALSSAYVIYFSRSVSLSKTASFFIILIALLFANEFLKKRISNKYLQFSIYFFVNFTFFTLMIPVFIKEVNPTIFIFSGLVSLISTFLLMIVVYIASPSTRKEIHFGKLLGIVLSIYITINTFYHFKLIPPVPLALNEGIAAHKVEVEGNQYLVTYESDEWYIFWRKYRAKFIHNPGERVYVFSSIFAPTDIKKRISHRWEWFDTTTNEWKIIEDIAYDLTGGRDGGYRGYTYKSNLITGEWRVEVVTEEELVLGVISFEIVNGSLTDRVKLKEEKF